MTFREYAKQKCDITDEQMDEGFHCPCFVGLLDMCNDGNGDCEKCWNREIPETPAPMTAEEAWELAKQVALTTNYVETARIFVAENICGIEQKRLFEDVFALTPQEAKAKLDEWESKQIQVGDVCKMMECSCVVTQVDENKKLHVVLLDDGSTDQIPFDSPLKLLKTGKNIDIQSVLEQISKE